MADLKTPFDKPIMPDASNLGGDTVISRGTDPLIDTGGDGGLKPFWSSEKTITPIPGGEETANSVSGMPLEPSRWEPSETPPEMPDLTMRNPGTIDKR